MMEKINLILCDKLPNQPKVYAKRIILHFPIHGLHCYTVYTLFLHYINNNLYTIYGFILESGLVGLVQPMLWDYSPTLDVDNTGKLGQNSLYC